MDESADAVIERAKAHIIKHGAYRYGPPIQELMDLVANVHNYRMQYRTDQGFIYRKLISRIEYNHIVDIETMISKFWYGAIQAILRAKPVGTEVGISNGTDECRRKTAMSPLNYIRNMGVAAGRKYIDECCRKRLKQLCHDCNKVTGLGKQREIDHGCKCGSKEAITPHAFVKHPIRICITCGTKRSLIFERVCGTIKVDENGSPWIPGDTGCGSNNVSIIQIEDYVEGEDADTWEWKFGITDSTPEDDVSSFELAKDAAAFAEACIKALPGDIADPNGDSQTRKILRILVDPMAGTDICMQCKASADCCGASSFAIDICTNYSRKLGEHFGYSTTLANRRVKKIRQHAIAFAIKNQHLFEAAKHIAESVANSENPISDHYYHQLHK
jgi:hypothetical protein